MPGPEQVVHDDDTMMKVAESIRTTLRESGIDDITAIKLSTESISSMQNKGILFRERIRA